MKALRLKFRFILSPTYVGFNPFSSGNCSRRYLSPKAAGTYQPFSPRNFNMIKLKATSALGLTFSLCGCGLPLFTVPATAAPTIWTGPTISYTQPGTDPTQSANQDRLTDSVWITRGPSMGIFNAVTESSYTHDVSPTGTRWAYGSLANYATLTYAPWEVWNGKKPPTMVGQDAVLHLIAEDIYLSIKFTVWPGILGGFSYERSTPPPVAPTLSNPQLQQNQFVFTANTTVGLAYVLESSSNLVQWVAVTTNVASGSTLNYTNNFIPTQPRYYRVGQRPAP